MVDQGLPNFEKSAELVTIIVDLDKRAMILAYDHHFHISALVEMLTTIRSLTWSRLSGKVGHHSPSPVTAHGLGEGGF